MNYKLTVAVFLLLVFAVLIVLLRNSLLHHMRMLPGKSRGTNVMSLYYCTYEFNYFYMA